MSKQKRKPRDPDVNVVAKSIINKLIARAGGKPQPESESKPHPVKNPAAVALAKLGAKKGGHVRAAKLSTKRKREIAKKAAEARWSVRR